jgi:hypothetical protein
MADDKSNRGPRDRERINIHERYEVEYWTKEVGVSEEKLKELVSKHGLMAEAVRAALRR